MTGFELSYVIIGLLSFSVTFAIFGTIAFVEIKEHLAKKKKNA